MFLVDIEKHNYKRHIKNKIFKNEIGKAEFWSQSHYKSPEM